jgi:K+-transporting ATPase ATPase A chain
MISHSILQFIGFIGVTLALMLPLGAYMACVFNGEATWLQVMIDPIEGLLYRCAGIRAAEQQDWKRFATAAIVFNLIGGVVLFFILLNQDKLPWNPQNLPPLSPDLAFNIAVSFVTNTDWQAYSGETTLSMFSQMMGLTVQDFMAPATGFAVAMAVIRGFVHKENRGLGNFYVDVTRAILYVLLPLAIIFAVFLISQGVPENMHVPVQAITLEGTQQMLPQGPVASQDAIKMLGSNGGGYFNANASHPYENPTPLSNFFQMISIILLSAALALSFGKMVGDRRQGWALFAAMSVLFVALFALCYAAEMRPNPAFAGMNIDQTITDTNSGGNMEGKEVRFGIFNSALWATATTATSDGATSASYDSFTPLGGLVPLFNMLVGEVIYGGVGCGLYGILIYVLITVFIAGLMVGRTPEYLGKKIEAYEIKLAIFAQLLYPICVLGFGVVALLVPVGSASISTTGPHGLTQSMYAYASAAANNGSAFGGFNGNTFFQNIMLGIVMLLGRYGVIIPVLAIAGSLAAKKTTPTSSGTLPTHGATFIALLIAVIVMFGGLTYFPALALGPIAEQLSTHTAGAP